MELAILILIIKGLCLGFAFSVPVGPVGALTIQRTLRGTITAGFVTGLGAATVEAFYALILGLTIQTLLDFFARFQGEILTFGGAFLIILAFKFFKHSVTDLNASYKTHKQNLLAFFASTVLITLTNPLVLLSFVGIYAALDILNQQSSLLHIYLFTSCFFIGSCSWWLLLSFMVARARTRIQNGFLHTIHKICGVLMLIFGIYSLGRALLTFL